jgi:hypothetical protein
MTHTRANVTEGAPDDVCLVAGDGGDSGRGHRRRFQDVETHRPVILTTSERPAQRKKRTADDADNTDKK